MNYGGEVLDGIYEIQGAGRKHEQIAKFSQLTKWSNPGTEARSTCRGGEVEMGKAVVSRFTTRVSRPKGAYPERSLLVGRHHRRLGGQIIQAEVEGVALRVFIVATRSHYY